MTGTQESERPISTALARLKERMEQDETCTPSATEAMAIQAYRMLHFNACPCCGATMKTHRNRLEELSLCSHYAFCTICYFGYLLTFGGYRKQPNGEMIGMIIVAQAQKGRLVRV